MRTLAEQAFSRAAAAPLIEGNAVRLLLDADANYAAWLAAIRSAEKAIYFENYIIKGDATGRLFREVLTERARAGIKVRVLMDWFGSFGTPRRFWRDLIAAGGEVRYHNPPRLDDPLGWLSRDHRKSLIVDGRTGHVSGVCVSDAWLGNPARKVEPWRDTGIELRGPAACDLLTAFASVWAANGDPIPEEEIAMQTCAMPEGETAVRVVATEPNVTGLYRLDLLVAALAERRLWLTDAYFAGTPSYVQALRAAARDGVDVRLLVPGGSDLPWLRPLTTAGYRPLIEAGVRVFEWNGSMLHAKTAVADDRWARVGSTNLNMASWLTNYELDVAIEDENFNSEMAAAYERDLEHSTEIILQQRRRVRLPCPDDGGTRSRPGRGSLARATAGALRFTRTVSAAIVNTRTLGADGAESVSAGTLAMIALTLAAIAVLAIFFPTFIAFPFAAVALTAATIIVIRAWRLRAATRDAASDAPPPA
jgi:cardiolipin synthase A/B